MTHQLRRVTELVYEGFTKREKIRDVFVDIPKFFDQVRHFGLICKLVMLQASFRLIHIYWNYLKGKTFSFKVNNYISSSRNIEVDVPQRNLTSSWLFSLYIIDIPSITGISLSIMCVWYNHYIKTNFITKYDCKIPILSSGLFYLAPEVEQQSKCSKKVPSLFSEKKTCFLRH